MKYALILLFFLMFGCATAKPPQQAQQARQACVANPQELAVGMTRDHVRDLYGNPLYIRSGLLKGGGNAEMWAYLNRGCPHDNTLVFFDRKGQVDHWQIYQPRDRNQILFLTQKMDESED